MLGLSWEVIFVDDDSIDCTFERVRQIARTDSRVRCIQRIGRKGLSSACVEGMLASSSPYLAVMDADMQHDESLLPAMLERLKSSGDDLVVASRFLEDASTGTLSPLRTLFSRTANFLSRYLLHARITDPMSGFFMLRREIIDETVRRLYGKGFKILLDLLATVGEGLRVSELPYSMGSRVHGESKLGLQVILEYFMLLLYKLGGRVIPTRYLMFVSVGATGVVVHFAALALLFKYFSTGFVTAQAVGTVLAMTSNFVLNNRFTYRDLSLQGKQVWRGLLTFYAACGVGALITVIVGDYLYSNLMPWWIAGILGAVVGSVWNFALTSSFTWHRRAPD